MQISFIKVEQILRR